MCSRFILAVKRGTKHALSLSLSLVLTAGAEVVTGEKVISGCYIVNLIEPVAERFIEARPDIKDFIKYQWRNGFSVARFPNEKLFFKLVLNDRYTLSVERCGIIRPHDVLNVAAPSKRAVDRVDQRSAMPDGLLRRTAGGVGQRIYLVDSGLTYAQTQRGNVESIYPSFPLDPYDDGTGHGSGMFEMIRDTSFGLAPLARIINLKGFSNNGGAGIDGVVAALRFLDDRSTAQGGPYPPGIVNLSLGQSVSPTSTKYSSMELVVNDLRNHGFVVVASAGNEDESIVNQSTGFKVVPAAIPGVIAVAGVSVATAGVDTRWAADPCTSSPSGICGSNYGPEVSLFAPATNQPTYAINGNFTNFRGTSGAAAYVSAVLATIGDFRPSLGLGQRFPFLQSLWTTSGVADARSANTGILMSDLGYVRKPSPPTLSFAQETRVCPGQTTSSIAPKVVTAQVRAERPNSQQGAALVVASYSVRNSECPGNLPLNSGPVDLVVEAFDPNSGLRLWRRQFADPNGNNVSISDNIGAVFEMVYTAPIYFSNLAVVINTNEPGRFAAIGRTLQAGTGLDTYIVLLEPSNGSVIRVIRYGGPGEDVGRALVSVGEDLVAVGTTDRGFNGNSVSGGSDVFAYAIGSDLQLSAPVTFVARTGSERVEAASLIPVAPYRDVLVVGGASVTRPSACSGVSIDTLALRLRVQPRTNGVPGTGAISVVSNQTFESPTSITPAIQLDDWADSIASVDSSTAVLGAQSRQFDCSASGVPYYFGPSSAQLVKYDFTINQVVWSRSRGLQNMEGKATAVSVGSSGVLENYHLVAMGSAWKFDLSGTQVFSETVPAGPLASFSGDFNAWFGDASGAEARDVR